MPGTEFGETVRRWRDRVAPQAAGLPAGARRRAPGLRREELAGLAGISVDYLTRLEQGRARNPSDQVVEALARGLRLTAAERTHLYSVAGLAPPGRGLVPGFVPPGVHRLLDRLAGTPVAVSDAMWTLLIANPPYVALMGEREGRARNGAWRTFVETGSRVRHDPEIVAATEAATVGDLRRTAGRYPDDPRLRQLVADLRAASQRFAELWDSGVVGEHTSSVKTIDHPVVGPITLDCDVVTVAGSDLRIMIYTAEPGSAAAERLSLLDVVGTQDLGPEVRSHD
jgi:transcriptional regulator with XRE-family HTH domain